CGCDRHLRGRGDAKGGRKDRLVTRQRDDIERGRRAACETPKVGEDVTRRLHGEFRHCEERSDEAIQSFVRRLWIAWLRWKWRSMSTRKSLGVPFLMLIGPINIGSSGQLCTAKIPTSATGYCLAMTRRIRMVCPLPRRPSSTGRHGRRRAR